MVNPYNILKDAISAVPAVKYALGILGIVAVIAIIGSLGVDYRIAVFGTVVLIVLMAFLLIFSQATKVEKELFRRPAIFLVWFTLAVIFFTTTFLFTSVFFRWPLNLKHFMEPPSEQPTVLKDNKNQDPESMAESIDFGIQDFIYSAVPLHESIRNRATVCLGGEDGFVLGLRQQNQLSRISRSTMQATHTVTLRGEPTTIDILNNKIAIGYQLPNGLEIRDSQTLEIISRASIPNDVIERFEFEQPSSLKPVSILSTSKGALVIVADDNSGQLLRFNESSQSFRVHEGITSGIVVDSDWRLFRGHTKIFALTTDTTPTYIYSIEDSQIIEFSGHDQSLIQCTTTLWPGRSGEIGIVSCDDELIELSLNETVLEPVARVGEITPIEGDFWVAMFAAPEGESFYLARTFYSRNPWRPTQSIITKHSPVSKVQTVYIFEDVEFISVAVSSGQLLVILRNTDNTLESFLLHPKN